MCIKNKQFILPLNSVALTSCAVFNIAIYEYISNSTLLVFLMLFLPLLDKKSIFPNLHFTKKKLTIWLVCISFGLTLTIINNEYLNIIIGTLALTALPEEWFFRSYVMTRIKHMGYKAYQANILTSLFFTLLHIPSQGIIGILVFFPSLIYGWVFNRSQDIVLVILLHALSNIVFFIYMPILKT